MATTAIVWLRNDLRVLDNEALLRAVQNYDQVIPLYVLAPERYELLDLGFPKQGAHAARFLLESLQDLRNSLRERSGELFVRQGQVASLLPELAATFGAGQVLVNKAVTDEELQAEEAVKAELHRRGLATALTFVWTSTLYHLNDLPFAYTAVPDVYTHFRRAVEQQSSVRAPLPAPTQVPVPPALAAGEIPTVAELGLAPPPEDPRAFLRFTGGEHAGWQRLRHYFWQTEELSRYKARRNGMLGADYSSKFSPWLAHGCLSARSIYAEVKQYEAQIVRNKSTYWLIFELIWRDFFRYVALKVGKRLFYKSGPQGLAVAYQNHWPHFEAWMRGETGVPLIDANMRELNATGFMSNRGRQNVASYLIKDLAIDWRWGAAYFESRLLDYDVCSNWGNWTYQAGVGNDPRENRYFNIMSQAQRYDKKGDYVRHWCPELRDVPGGLVHQVFRLNEAQQRQYGLRLGRDYPRAIYVSPRWQKYY
jgi:deoxyribodipyrimidine photo-lyase